MSKKHRMNQNRYYIYYKKSGILKQWSPDSLPGDKDQAQEIVDHLNSGRAMTKGLEVGSAYMEKCTDRIWEIYFSNRKDDFDTHRVKVVGKHNQEAQDRGYKKLKNSGLESWRYKVKTINEI